MVVEDSVIFWVFCVVEHIILQGDMLVLQENLVEDLRVDCDLPRGLSKSIQAIHVIVEFIQEFQHGNVSNRCSDMQNRLAFWTSCETHVEDR